MNNAPAIRKHLSSLRTLTIVCTALALALSANSVHAQRAATAIAQVINGFVIGVTVTDGGADYQTAPAVRFSGGGGSGAGAYAVVSNGTVATITVTNAGFGYTYAPIAWIDAPPPVLSAAQMWFTQRTATATAQLFNGFVVGVTVTDGGDGYETAPAVRFFSGGGSGALAYASLSGNAVGSITVTNAGFGYTNSPRVSIAEPTNWQKYARMNLRAIEGANCLIQYVTNLAQTNGWTLLTNVAIPSSPWLFTDYASPQSQSRFYRAVGLYTNLPPSPGLPTNMALIPTGSFTMGDTFSEGDANELPTHPVQVSAFYMDKYEVTKALWDEVYNWAVTHGYSFEDGAAGKASNHPAHSMTWYDAVKWCNARSEKEGRTPAYYTSAAQTTVYRSGQTNVENAWVKWDRGYRLPTEAEWEKAARGGASGHRFPWSDTDNITHSMANYRSSSSYPYDTSPTRNYHTNFNTGDTPYTSPAGYFAANGHGLYDMAGNVWEWCWDWNGAYSSGSQIDPRGSASGSSRVFRSGSWGDDARLCRSAYRHINYPAYRSHYVGFRSVLPPGQ